MTRSDITPGAQLAQTNHAAFEFAIRYPEITKEWNKKSNYICIVACRSLEHLIDIKNKAEIKQIKFAEFYEPDINNELTAIALEPSELTRKLCSSIPLALKML